MKLILHHVPNEDIAHDERQGYWSGKPVGAARRVVPVASFVEAARVLRDWSDANGLGCGNMARDCGNVLDDAGKVIAQVSYNGRVWEPGKWPTKEILT